MSILISVFTQSEVGSEHTQTNNSGWGLNPEEILTKDALTKGNATVIGRQQLEEHQLHQLSIALKQQLPKEMREEQNAGRTKQ